MGEGEAAGTVDLPFTVDLTAQAARGAIDPVVGRDALIDRVVETLARRTKNHPLLVGPAGVGKSAIVEGLALRIASGEAPRFLREARLVALDLGGLVAGARLRGELEERLQAVLRRVEAAGEGARPIVLFIDEAHLLGAAAAGEGAVAVAGLLKPALARGRLPCIAATTDEDYRRHLLRDAALARRFQPIAVGEPAPAEARAVLAGLRPRYEAHHGVRVGDDALDAAVALTVRHLPARRLPDKAIDALDEACARARLHARGGLAEPLDAAAIALVVARMAGLADARVGPDERARLAGLEAALAARVVGQAEAVEAAARAVRRVRAGLADPRRPASMLFVGPTGVGKTRLARALAEALAGDEDALVRIDLAEYGEAHAAARLYGAPPGYVGHDAGGQLTEALRRRPDAIILLDEADKAHPRALAPLLPLLDEGRLTDGEGRTADARHAIVILTAAVAPAAARFPTELLARLDEIVLFRPLDRADLAQIAAQQLIDAFARASATPPATADREHLASVIAGACDLREGARGVRQSLQRLILDPLADALLALNPPTFEAAAEKVFSNLLGRAVQIKPQKKL